MRYHAQEQLIGGSWTWIFEEKESSLLATNMQLVRVMIAKVEKRDRLISILRNVPIREGTAGWNCVGWVQEALQMLVADGKALGTGVTEWAKVRDAVMQYCQQKKEAHRFDGQAPEGIYDRRKVATFDLIEGKETIPWGRVFIFRSTGFTQKSPKYLSRVFSISNWSGIGSMNLSTSSCQNSFCGLTCQFRVYSQ